MIEIKHTKITGKQLAELFVSSGIQRPTEDIDRMQRMLNNANVLLSAWDGQALVGVLRGVSDMSYCAFVSDLAVAREYQRQGIGSNLLKVLHAELGENISIVLLSAPSAMNFYPRLNFKLEATAFKQERAF